MKKLFFYLIGVILAGSLKAAVVTVVLAPATVTNVSTVVPAPFRITGITLSSPANSSPKIYFFDAPGPGLKVTNASYTTISSYATNYITLYTNYYGATNTYSATNNPFLVDITNTVAAVTNSVTPFFIAQSPTNQTTVYQNLNLPVTTGLFATNVVADTGVNATFIITYTQ